MLKDITLGQFFPGSSPIHRLDPRVKLVLVVLLVVLIFSAKNIFAFSFLVLGVISLVLLSQISVKVVLKAESTDFPFMSTTEPISITRDSVRQDTAP